MRRATSIVALILMLVVATGATASAAAVTYSAEAGTGHTGDTLPISAFVHNAAPGTTFTAVAEVAQWGASVTFGSEVAVTTALMARSHHQPDHKKDKHHKHPKHEKKKHGKDV
jgi:hypothetical protein